MKRLFISITILFLLGSINAQTTVSLFKNCGKYGIINADKKIIIPANFDEIKIDEVIFCKNNTGKSIVYDDKLKILYQFNNGENKIKMISPDLFYYTRGDGFYETKYLFKLSTNKETVTRFRWNEGNNKNAPWIAYKTGFSSKIEQHDDFTCQHAYPYRNNRALILNDNRDGEIIDENFKTVVSKIYAAADYYSENLIPVVLNDSDNKPGKSYYLDLNGNIAYECKFDFKYIDRDEIKEIQVPEVIGSFNEGIALVQTNQNKWLILDKAFNFIEMDKNLSPKSKCFSNGLLVVSTNIKGTEKYGFINKKAELVIPCEYEKAESFIGNYAVVEKNGISGIIDLAGKFIAIIDLK